MELAAETDVFSHEHLPDARTYIRLLKISSIDQERDIPVHCELTTWPKASAPTYTAISYTWGDRRLVAVMLVNGKRMQVRRNCEDVLKQPCRNNNGCFWIDAICINQVDNHEKSFQVAQMGEVFKNARQTLACVGRHENQSEFLFERLHKYRHKWRRLGRGIFNRIDGYFILRDRPWPLFDSNSTLDRLYHALGRFLMRPYFRRVWIYQELFFGKNIHICCEDETVKLSLLWALTSNLRLWGQSYSGPLQNAPLFSHIGTLMEKVIFLLEGGVMGVKPRPLRQTIIDVERLECEDIRDRVFGTLAIIDWNGRKPIQPDYNKDPFDLAVEVLQILETETIDGMLKSGLTNAVIVAKLMGFFHQLSPRLVREIRTREWMHSEALEVRPEWIAQRQVGDSRFISFLGYRLYFYDTSFHIMQPRLLQDPVDPSALRPWSPNGLFLSIQRRSRRRFIAIGKTDVLLPHGVQPQDWLLIPLNADTGGRQKALLTFVARDIDESQLQLVGPAVLTSSQDWGSRSWQSEGQKFGVYLDPEDAIVLAHSCGWNDSGWVDEPDTLRHAWGARIFETSLCGERSRSYAIR